MLRTTFFFEWLKCYSIQNIPWKLKEKMLFQEICASWKQMLGIDREAIFPFTKKIYLYNLLYLAALKILNTCGVVILALSFPDNMIFLETLLS